ncbi:MAG: hypothetical protein KKA73_25050 [Chloroflexi bacterium]|nr:hypothetical protein [Chloroflexota bacterium]MBU1750965.1 hypothetical protein [Chloroflexota bacterium]
MHTKRIIWSIGSVLFALCLLVTLALPALASESRPPSTLQDGQFQEADPADRVRAELEAKGYTVRKVGVSTSGDLAGVYMDMVAYEFDDTVRQQIVDGWYAISKVYTDPAIEVYLSGLVYQEQYLLCFFVAPADFQAWIAGTLSDQAFAGKYTMRILDLATGEWVEDKDFLHKNFGAPTGVQGAEAVGPLPKPVEGSSKPAFEDDFSDPTSGWESKTTTDYSYGYADGEYFCREEQDNYMVRGQYPGLEFGDFIYQAEGRQAEGDAENEYGLIFRYVDGDYYKFGVTGDGYYHLSLRQNGEWTAVVDWAESRLIKRGDQVNVLKVVCAGEDISLYINDEFIVTAQGQGPTEGLIGLFAGGWENMPTEARFDNLKVWTGSPGPEASPTPTTTVTAGTPVPTPTTQTGGTSFGPITFSTQVEKGTNKPSDPGTSFPASTSELHATWDYSGMKTSNTWSRKWYVDGKIAIDKTEAWNGGTDGRWDNYLFMNSGKTLPVGTYKLEIYIDGKLEQTATCTIGGTNGGSGALGF